MMYNRDSVWTERGGRRVAIKDMGTTHLRRCIAFLNRMVEDELSGDWAGAPGMDEDSICGAACATAGEEWGPWIDAMENELRSRGGAGGMGEANDD